MFSKKWAQLTAVTISFPSMLLVSGIVIKNLIEKETISKTLGVILFLILIIHSLALILIYANKKKNKS